MRAACVYPGSHTPLKSDALAWLRIDPPNAVTIHTISRMTAKIGSRAREKADTVTIQVSVGQWGNRLLWSL